jgi:GT2 family glycosyltransferase
VQLERAPLGPGWVELEAAVPSRGSIAQPILRLTGVGGEADAIDVALPPLNATLRTITVWLDQPVQRAKIVLQVADASGTGAAARMRSVSVTSLLQRTWRSAPEELSRAAFWRLVGKKRRAGNILKRVLHAPPAVNYGAWLAARISIWEGEAKGLERAALEGGSLPRLSYLVAADQGEPIDPATRASIVAEAGHGAEIVEAPQAATGDWCLALHNGDRLARGAIARILACLGATPETALVYGDHDHLDHAGRRCRPHFKPQWSLPLFLAYDYIGLVAFRLLEAHATDAFAPANSSLGIDEIILRVAGNARPGSIVRIPRILSHRPEALADRRFERPAVDARRRLVASHLARQGEDATAQIDANGHIRVVRRLPTPPPLVSVIVPTRDRLDLLTPCIEGLRHGTDYPALEIVIADNDSRERRTLSYLEGLASDRRVRVVRVPGPFNFSAINNRAAAAANGHLLAFLNNDIEVIGPDWLGEMVGHALEPGIGAVGAKLIYATGSVQHAGVVLGIRGAAEHAHRFFPADHLGYMRRLACTQNFAAVTAACMVVERKKFAAVHGFDEEAFPVALNDVDLCLKLDRLGFRTLYTPYAVLTHKEGATRARDVSRLRQPAYARELQNFRARWQAAIDDDPCYNPNLSRAEEDFSLR